MGLLAGHTRVDGEVVARLVDWRDDGVDAEPFLTYWTRGEQNDCVRDDTWPRSPDHGLVTGYSLLDDELSTGKMRM